MEAELIELSKAIESHLRCTICKKHLIDPVVCRSGHSICVYCFKRHKTCTECGQEVTSFQNKVLNELASFVKIPCRNQKYGCKELFHHSEWYTHQKNCPYEQQKCHASGIVGGRECSWTGNRTELNTHLKEKHPGVFSDHSVGEIITINDFCANSRYERYILAFNEPFHIFFIRLVDAWYTLVNYLGPPPKASKYKYKFEIFNEDYTVSTAVTQMTTCGDESVYGRKSSKICGKFNPDMVLSLMDSAGDLLYKIEIIKIGD